MAGEEQDTDEVFLGSRDLVEEIARRQQEADIEKETKEENMRGRTLPGDIGKCSFNM